MCLPRLRLCALAACCLLMGCASSPPRVSAPLLPPPPAALLQSCPPPPPIRGAEMDALALTLKQVYDAYGACAAQLRALVRWLEVRALTEGE